MRHIAKLAAAALVLAELAGLSAVQTGPALAQEDVWQPAPTPRGGVSWSLLESTRVNDRRDANMMILSTPTFPAAVRRLNGRRITVAGWMMPLENAARQTHFVLLGYPPGCPFHTHALPNQFIEVRAPGGVPIDEVRPITITGTLQLTGQDESGIFYRLVNARPVSG